MCRHPYWGFRVQSWITLGLWVTFLNHRCAVPTEMPGNDHWFIKIPKLLCHICHSYMIFLAIWSSLTWHKLAVYRHLSHRLCPSELVTPVSLKTWKEISTSRQQFIQDESKLHAFPLEVPVFLHGLCSPVVIEKYLGK